jgi:transposase
MGQRKAYPSDVSREQFEQIGPLPESVRKRTKPRLVDLHEVFNAVLYLLESGCQWRMLAQGFPNRSTVYSYFAKWSAVDRHGVSALKRALKNRLARPASNRGATRRPASSLLRRRA